VGCLACDEHTATARMEWRYRVEIGADLTRIERIAGRTRWSSVLPRDARSDALTGIVRECRGSVGEHVEPLSEERQLSLPIVFGPGRPGRGRGMQTIPPIRKHVGSCEEYLPAIEFGPREIPTRGHRRHHARPDQRWRCHGPCLGGWTLVVQVKLKAVSPGRYGHSRVRAGSGRRTIPPCRARRGTSSGFAFMCSRANS
jgi:hypothetical protein